MIFLNEEVVLERLTKGDTMIQMHTSKRYIFMEATIDDYYKVTCIMFDISEKKEEMFLDYSTGTKVLDIGFRKVERITEEEVVKMQTLIKNMRSI